MRWFSKDKKERERESEGARERYTVEVEDRASLRQGGVVSNKQAVGSHRAEGHTHRKRGRETHRSAV